MLNDSSYIHRQPWLGSLVAPLPSFEPSFPGDPWLASLGPALPSLALFYIFDGPSKRKEVRAKRAWGSWGSWGFVPPEEETQTKVQEKQTPGGSGVIPRKVALT
jgi:hypothetical protein